MIANLGVRRLLKRVRKWYRRIVLILETKYQEHVGFNEF
jgi:hypothetical protein